MTEQRTVPGMLAQLLEAKLKQLELDKARLDWLTESLPKGADIHNIIKTMFAYDLSFRQAIDKHMKEGE